MKIALCLHGYFDTKSNNKTMTGVGGAEHLNKVLVGHAVDTYYHSWQPRYDKLICQLYKVKKFKSQQQKDFNQLMDKRNIRQQYFDQKFDRKNSMYANATIFNTLSFLYSRHKALQMVQGDYDWVITSRFDISQRGGRRVNTLRFFPYCVNNFLYSRMWDQLNAGYGDMWFYGSKEIMLKLSKLYHNRFTYFQRGSAYQRAVTGGWPDSLMYDVYDVNRPRQFSNQVLKYDKSGSLMKYPKWMCVNNHMLYKWFCIDTGLYEVSKWV